MEQNTSQSRQELQRGIIEHRFCFVLGIKFIMFWAHHSPTPMRLKICSTTSTAQHYRFCLCFSLSTPMAAAQAHVRALAQCPLFRVSPGFLKGNCGTINDPTAIASTLQKLTRGGGGGGFELRVFLRCVATTPVNAASTSGSSSREHSTVVLVLLVALYYGCV